MALIIYADRLVDAQGGNISAKNLREKFSGAAQIRQSLEKKDCRIAYLFIDPLLDAFEAANRFYFDILGCRDISTLNIYRSGCSPIQALADAKTLLDNDLADAAFIFGHEPLSTLKQTKGKPALQEAMDIFEEMSIPAGYNSLAHRLIELLGISREDFLDISNRLYANYLRTYPGDDPGRADRTKYLEGMDADLFTLTDCANPYVDFSSGVIVTSAAVADALAVPKEKRTELRAAKYNIVGDGPAHIDVIAGSQDDIFPHVRRAYERACKEADLDFAREFKAGNALLEVYTCYPPIPIGFLLATKIADRIEQIAPLLEQHAITVTGGMSLARAPWNNPALNGLIALIEELPRTNKEYGLVHGNGGLGGLQGVAILKK
ncbi:MAG: hypothetical protein RBT41_10810 [Clostridia bacterium]|jgi:acetyl-CoA acetyltransferase|nr:hypothetical protein [Clostridia bacterium]